MRREQSSELEPRRLIVSCSSELDICSNPSTESFPAAACKGQRGHQLIIINENLLSCNKDVTAEARNTGERRLME